MKKRPSRQHAASSVGSPSYYAISSSTLKILSVLIAVAVGVSFFVPTFLLNHDDGRDGAQHSVLLLPKKKPKRHALSARRHQRRISGRGGTTAGGDEEKQHDENEDDDCSCIIERHNKNHRRSCCDRKIIRVHKMGYALIAELFGADKGISVASLPDRVDIQFYENASRDVADYRYVIVTRNLYDALISGYLYHKMGHECWKNENGGSMAGRRQRYKGWLQTYNWEQHLKDTYVIPPALGRNLCTYLADESEQDGMRVYVDVALQKWYRGVRVARELALQSSVGGNRTLFVCYEQLISTREQSMREIMEWMYPGKIKGSDKDAFTSQHRILPVKSESHQASVYSGGHATSHDPELRLRLRSIIERLDEELFHGEIASLNAALSCGNS